MQLQSISQMDVTVTVCCYTHLTYALNISGKNEDRWQCSHLWKQWQHIMCQSMETHETLSGQALKAIFKLKAYVNKFTDFSVSHMLGLFDKLILPILSHGSEVSGFSEADNIERTHLQFCKHLLGVRIQTQNNFVYGELRRVPLRNHR